MPFRFMNTVTTHALRTLLLAWGVAGSIGFQGQKQTPMLDPATSATMAPNGPFTGDFSAYVEQVMDEWKVPGLAIAVIDGDDVFTQASTVHRV